MAFIFERLDVEVVERPDPHRPGHMLKEPGDRVTVVFKRITEAEAVDLVHTGKMHLDRWPVLTTYDPGAAVLPGPGDAL